MKVSIITPTYNSEKFLNQTIDAIISQTFKDWELLITDDCSDDNTWKILTNYTKKDSRIKIFQLNKNSGPGIARNNSIREAKGRFIAFCDSDDVWLPDKLEKQLAFMEKNNLVFTYSAYQKIDEDSNKGGIITPPSIVSYNDLLKTCSIGCLTAIYDTKTIGKMYMPEIRKRQDYGLWLKIFKKIGASQGTDEVLGYYRERKNSVSSNKFIAARFHFKILREVAKVPRLKAYYYFFIYALSGLIKYLK